MYPSPRKQYQNALWDKSKFYCSFELKMSCFSQYLCVQCIFYAYYYTKNYGKQANRQRTFVKNYKKTKYSYTNALFRFRAASALYSITVSPAQQRRTFWPSVFTGNKSINAHSGHVRQSVAQTLWPAFGNEVLFAIMTLMTICLSSSEALPSVPGELEHLVGVLPEPQYPHWGALTAGREGKMVSCSRTTMALVLHF